MILRTGVTNLSGERMRLNDLLEKITVLRGQQYGTDMIMGWVNEIEGQVIDEIIKQAEGFDIEFKPLDYQIDSEKQLSIPDRFQDVYINYLLSKIDFHNEETERYNNDVIMYNSAYDAFSAWFRRQHRAKRGPLFSIF